MKRKTHKLTTRSWVMDQLEQGDGEKQYMTLAWDMRDGDRPRMGDRIEMRVDPELNDAGAPEDDRVVQGRVVDTIVKGVATSIHGPHCQLLAAEYDYLIKLEE